MVNLQPGSHLSRAFEEALRSVLPPDWGMSLGLDGESADSGVDAYLNLTPPTGDRIQACVEFKTRAEPSEVVRLVPWLKDCGPAILVAPTIGARAREILTSGGISWMEPDGDCRIALGGLFIERLGRSRPRKPAGAKDTRYVSDLFSGGALRVVRWLLIEPDRPWSLADMAERTWLTQGFASRTFKTLARDAYLDRRPGANRVADRDALLEAWAAAPPPADEVSERVATVSSVEAIVRMLREQPAPANYALTAEAAAQKLAPLARYSRVELYCDDVFGWDEKLGLVAVPRGGNLILIRPVDRGVFDGSFDRDGVTMVSRPQLYVDLKRRGSAASEGAAFLRERGELWPR